MTLRLRSLLVLLATMAGLTVTLAVAARWVIMRGFQVVETHQVQRTVERATAALQAELDRLALVASDWATWDELHACVSGRNPGFAAREINDNVLAALGVNHLLLFRPDLELAQGASFDLDARQRRDLPDDVLQRILGHVTLARIADPPQTHTAVLAGEPPLLVSSRPVLHSDSSGPAAGTLVLAREVNQAFAAQLSRQTRCPVDILPPTADDRADQDRFEHDRDIARGYRLLAEPDGTPALVLRAELPREVMQVGRRSALWLLALLAGTGALASVVLVLLLDARVFRRLTRLVRDVQQVRARADFAGRVAGDDEDEVGQLADEVNGMLATLERVHGKLQQMNNDLEQRVAERTAELEASRAALADDAEHRRAQERSAAERERFYRALYDLSPAGVMVEKEDGTILDVNDALCRALGYTREELVGSNVRRLAPPGQQTGVERDLARLLAGEELLHRVANMRKDGSLCHMELREKAITLPDGQRRIIVTANDVTERFAAEEQLRVSEQRYHTLFSTMITGFALHEIVCDSEGRPVDYIFLDVNPAFTSITGKRREEVVGRRVSEVLPGTEPIWIERFGRVALTGQPEAFSSFSQPLGRHFSVMAYSPQRGQFAVNFLDITEQRRTEDQLRLQGTALESAANGMMIVDRSGKITWVNRAFTQLTGYERADVLGRTPRVLKSNRQDEAFYRDLWQTVLGARMWRGELVNRRKDGTLYLEEMTITPVLDEYDQVSHFVAIKQDITERRQLQHQLFQAQKMEGIGRLAGGIAHDFNNLLQAISGFSSLLLEGLAPDSPHRQDVLEIERAARRATELTRQLLAFSRRQMIEPRVVDLNQLVENTEKMLRRLIGEDVQLVTELQADLDRVRVDPGQIEQVLMNLTVNARDAMPAGGRLTITTNSIVFLKEDALLVPEARHGRFVCLALSDTGLGMSKQVLEHIFEPFFTTKGAGKGTGLGLSVVYGIVRQHDGMIHVYSQVGEGTTFRIYLPVFESAEAESVEGTRPAEGVATALYGKGERLLLVEDEDGVRDFAIRTLRRYGYDLLVASSLEEARQLFSEGPDGIDALFTDVVLPDGNGLDLAEELRARKPGLRLLFSSGYMDDKSRWPMIRDRGYRFLQKPYPIQDLLAALREVLSA
jgi:PAS domain S-box-containing protein